jgi:hypothetical protein
VGMLRRLWVVTVFDFVAIVGLIVILQTTTAVSTTVANSSCFRLIIHSVNSMKASYFH